jgi:dTDP-4-dehydrorhamnose reductase
MTRVLILGANGMLGSEVYNQILTEPDLKVEGTTRNGSPIGSKALKSIELNLSTSYHSTLAQLVPKFDYIVNCVGVIPQKYSDKIGQNISSAIKVNSIFPNVLNDFASEFDTRVIQIATDCVFSGNKGDYSESSIPDPSDLYAVTKEIGEIKSANFMNIRCSVIGPEIDSSHSLFSWLLNHQRNEEVRGFKNHFWNGITTLAFAKIAKGIIKENEFKDGIQHLIPNDTASKFRLLEMIAFHADRSDLKIIPWEHEQTIRRNLATDKPSVNVRLWQLGRYDQIPNIEDLIEETVTEKRTQRSQPL